MDSNSDDDDVVVVPAMLVEEVVEEVVIVENERYLPGRGWSRKHLLALDPHAYANVADRRLRGATADEAAPSVGLWVDPEWRVALGETDANGWRYASRFSASTWRARPSGAVVRSRGWRRRLARRLEAGEVSPAGPPSVCRSSGGDAPPPASSGPRARLIELARSIREADEALEALAAKPSSSERRQLRDLANEARARAEGLEERAEGVGEEEGRALRDAAARARETEDRLVKEELFPGLDPRFVARGDGAAVGAKAASVERVAGQFIVHAHPSSEMPQLLLEALGSEDDAGVAVEAVVEGLSVRAERPRAGLPSSLKLRRVALKAQIAVSARVSCRRKVVGGLAQPSLVEFEVETLSIKLEKWAAPGILSKTTASAILSLVKPTIKRAIEASLPAELGLLVLELRSPLVVAGEFSARATPSLGVSSAKLDGNSPESREARELCGWTRAQAEAFAAARDQVMASNGQKRRLESLGDIVGYAGYRDIAGGGGSDRPTPRRIFEHRARLDAAWSQVAALWSLHNKEEHQWTWASARDAARRLGRRPFAFSLRIPTLAGAVGLKAAHDRCWRFATRKVEEADLDESKRRKALEGLFEIRDKARREIELLTEIVGSAEARLDLDLSKNVALEIRDAKLATPTFPGLLKLYRLADHLDVSRGRVSRCVSCPFDLQVRRADAGGLAIDLRDEDVAWATLTLQKPRCDLAVDDAFREALPAEEPVLEDAILHSLARISVDDGDLTLDASPHLVGRAACDHISFEADVHRVLETLLDIFSDLPGLREWWPDVVDDVRCADARDALHFLATHLFTNRDPFPQFKLALALAAKIRTDSKKNDRDAVVSAATLNHGITLRADLYARDLVLAVFALSAKINHRRLFGLDAAADNLVARPRSSSAVSSSSTLPPFSSSYSPVPSALATPLSDQGEEQEETKFSDVLDSPNITTDTTS